MTENSDVIAALVFALLIVFAFVAFVVYNGAISEVGKMLRGISPKRFQFTILLTAGLVAGSLVLSRGSVGTITLIIGSIGFGLGILLDILWSFR